MENDVTIVEPRTRSEPRQTQESIQDLIKSCRFQAPKDLHLACNELLEYNFHSEDGKLLVINKLKNLDGKFVVKLIRKGLLSLNRVYTDPETFEDEAKQLVELCCSQFKSMKNGSDNGQQIASPAIIIDWTVELCDELIKPKEESSRQSISSHSLPLLSSCLSKITNIYEILNFARLAIVAETQAQRIEVFEPFKLTFEALKPRIHFEEFNELLDQTVAIIKTDEQLDPKMMSKLNTKKQAILLEGWISLLNLSIVNNWFAVQTAKHDFLVNDKDFAKTQPFSDNRTYNESLISVLSDELKKSITCDKQFKLPCDKPRLQTFFDHSEVLLRYSGLCFKILQSDISTNQIQEVLGILQIQRNTNLLPVITETESQELQTRIKTIQQSLLSPNPKKLEQLTSEERKHLDEASKYRYNQTVIFIFIIETLLAISDRDREQLVEVLRLWSHRFPTENLYNKLLEILVLVNRIVGLQNESFNGMSKLNNFLSQLSKDLLNDISIWLPFARSLIVALPNTWDRQGFKIISDLVNKYKEIKDPGDGISEKLHVIQKSIESLTDIQGPEDVKIKAIEIGLDMFEYAARPEDYRLVANVILFVVFEMKTNRIRKYVSDLLKVVHHVGADYVSIWNAIRLIQKSCSIEKKEEIFHCFLKFLQDAKTNVNIMVKINTCGNFLRFPVNTANAKRFLEHAALDETNICKFIFEFLCFNEVNLNEDNLNGHVEFLLQVTPSLKEEHRSFFFAQWFSYPSVDIFEVIIASIAGSIAVGTFNRNANDEILKLLHAAIRTHNLSQPNDVLSLYTVLGQGFREVSSLRMDEVYIRKFAEGLNFIVRLPLTFLQLRLLISKISTILDKGKFSDEKEVTSIMFHLFKLPNSVASSINPHALASHLDNLILPSLVSKLAKLQLHSRLTITEGRVEVIEDRNSTCLTELIVKKIPKTFEEGSSVDLFKFVVEEMVNQDQTLPLVLLPMVDATVDKNVSVEAFKAKIRELTEKVSCIPSGLIPLITECITEFYAMGLEDKTKIFNAIEVLVNHLNWDALNTKRIYENLYKLNIAKHTALAFKEKTWKFEELELKLKRIFNVISDLSPSILHFVFLMHHDKTLHEQLKELFQHDFHMLLHNTCLKSIDVCFSLLLYNRCRIIEVLNISLQKDKACLNEDNDWSTKYDQKKLLTPGKLAYLVIHQLRRLGIEDVRNELNNICNKLVENYSICCTGFCSNQQLTNGFQEYFELFISIMNESSSIDEVRYWLSFSAHHALQCKNVIMAACSWKKGSKRLEDTLQINGKVSQTLLKLRNKSEASTTANFSVPACYIALEKELDVMAVVVKKIEDEEIICKLLDLLCLSVRSTEACLDIIPSWSKNESLLLVDKIESLYVIDQEITNEEIDNELAVALQILPFAAKALPDATKLVNFLTTMAEKNGGPNDLLSLARLPVWYKQMTEAGYPSAVIHSWCTCLVFSKNLSPTDVDAIANLTPEILKFLSKETDEIGKCLFLKEAPKTWETDDSRRERINTESFKRCLLLAKLINECFSIASQLKENQKIVQRIKDGTHILCKSFSDEGSLSGNIYKSRDNILKDLFVLLFSGVNAAVEDNKSMAELTNREPLSKSLVLLFRRLARSVQRRPITFGYLRTIVEKIQNYREEKVNPKQHYRDIQRIILEEVLSLEKNKASMDTLEASGYNQGASKVENLWYSSSFHMPAYVPRIESVEQTRMGSLLRQLWGEWRTILLEHNIKEVDFNEKKVKTSELFNYSDSLEIMELQLKAVKKVTHSLPPDNWSSYRSKELVRLERKMRAKNKKQTEEVEENLGSLKQAQVLIVWENRLLETIKMCSEKIPGCYAPNGFHSEKPVICGISVDNRIVTLYQEGKPNSRTELENVEVKLFPAGMFVFGRFSSSHPYDTEQLWAAFYKMLLDKRLVPKIFLSNVSPAFDWIKQFVIPEASPPRNTSFRSCSDLIPPSEDSFDYDPDIDVHHLHTVLASSQMKELIILTPENVKQLQIFNVKAPIANRKQLIKEQMDQVMPYVSKELQKMHPQSHGKILKRLMTPIRRAVEISVDGNDPKEELISSSIDLKKLLGDDGNAQPQKKGDYSIIILDAVKTVTGSLQNSRKPYDGCEHVVFVQPYE